ncbi:type III secretion protein HrpB4 [Trinickia acidisoli]|uniref:type III secretion protein HrpB4 n=1 Tax=Trinickia acidisoli TaxID=2767482 RepID=UPI001A8CDCF1|nr:type III secretion protein HrpB4 [Trinickia acidisoli]
MQVEMNVQSPAGRAAAWLTQLEQNRSTAVEWIDRSWLPTWLAAASLPENALAAPDCAKALMQALALPALDSDLAFDYADTRQAAAGRRYGMRLAALPVADQVRMLHLRSLVFRRGEVRRVVDRARRERLAASLGDEGGALLRWLQSLAGAPEMSTLARTIGVAPLDTLDEDALAWEGYCLFERDGMLIAGNACAALLRLALPRALMRPAWLARCPREIDADGGERVCARLPILFPERAWSFGCETPTSN